MIKVIFLGNSNISTFALRSILESKNIEVVAVVTTKPKPVGRNHSKLIETPVQKLANEHNLNVINTNSINKDIEQIKNLNVDFLLTCSFGQFLSDEVLSIPKKYALNIHTSLLPKGRGGAPIHWAIMNGERKTGVSYMEMVSEMDAGDYFRQLEVSIEKNETYDSLEHKLSKLIYDNTSTEIVNIYNDVYKKIKQNPDNKTLSLNIKKSDQQINWFVEAKYIDRKIRGLYSKPIAFTIYNGLNVKINSAIISKHKSIKLPGTIEKISKEGIFVSTGTFQVTIKNITIQGKKPIDVSQLLNGNHMFKVGDSFE